MATWYLDSAATGSGTGTSWTNAFTTWSAAQTAASAGDTIYIAGGVQAIGSVEVTKNLIVRASDEAGKNQQVIISGTGLAGFKYTMQLSNGLSYARFYGNNAGPIVVQKNSNNLPFLRIEGSGRYYLEVLADGEDTNASYLAAIDGATFTGLLVIAKGGGFINCSATPSIAVEINGSGPIRLENARIENNKQEFQRSSGSSPIDMVGCVIAGNWRDAIILAGGTSGDVNIDRCVIVGNSVQASGYKTINNASSGTCRISGSIVHGDARTIGTGSFVGVTDGGGNIGYTGNLPSGAGFAKARRPGTISLMLDDYDTITTGFWASWTAMLESKGIRGSLCCETRNPSISAANWQVIRNSIAAGHSVSSHGRSSANLSTTNAFNLQYVGAGSACTMTISGGVLTTSVTGGPGGQDLNVNLSGYTALSLYNYINATFPGVYTASTLVTAGQGNLGTSLAAVAGQDIRTSAYTITYDMAAVYADELDGSKADYNANGVDVQTYVYPQAGFTSAAELAVRAAGFTGGRVSTLGPMYLTGWRPWKSPSLFLESYTADRKRYAALIAEWVMYTGAHINLYSHPYGGGGGSTPWTIAQWEEFVDALIATGVPIITYDQQITYLESVPGTYSDGGLQFDGDLSAWDNTWHPNFKLNSNGGAVRANGDGRTMAPNQRKPGFSKA